MPTVRQLLQEILARGPCTAEELSAGAGVAVKEVLLHLAHVQKTVRPPRRFVVEPAQCLSCGFVFKDRRKLSPPGRCPRCKDSHLQDPRYRIV